MPSAITTADQLLYAGDIGRCELVRGELTRMIPAGGDHGRITYRLGFELGKHVVPNELGTILAAETGFVLARDPDTVRAPDVAFVRTGKPTGPGFIPGAPDLVVEVLSPDDRPGYVREKTAEWLEAGALLVWIVDPRTRTVTVHEPGHEPRTLNEGDTLDGGAVLPGFTLPVDRIWS